MFYIHSDVTITSDLEISDLAKLVSRALNVSAFSLDVSGRYEGRIVYCSTTFGLEFELAKDDPPARTYHLSINTDIDAVDLDGSEREVDGATYVIILLRRGGLVAAPRDPALLYG